MFKNPKISERGEFLNGHIFISIMQKMLLIFKALNTLYPHHTKAIKFMYKRVQLAKRRKSKHGDIDISMYVFLNEQCSAYKLKEQANTVFTLRRYVGASFQRIKGQPITAER
jgi:hypothetical protein